MKQDKFTYLKSVGSFIDNDTLEIYPANDNGTPDLNCPTEFEEGSEEWFDALSIEDLNQISQIHFDSVYGNKNEN